MVRSNMSAGMETTFYEEQSYGLHHHNQHNQLKRSLTLDLNTSLPQIKRTKLAGVGAPVLSSPDIQLLKMASPDMEKFLTGQGSLSTPTPSQLMFPMSAMPTEEQELYARGFVDALNELHHSDSSQGAPAQPIYTNLDRLPQSTGMQAFPPQTFVDVQVKDEPQTVPSIGSSPPLSPIDMECQEKIKLERKRQRNRLAASKCRRRKLERISRLEDKVKMLKGENTELSTIVLRLKEHVCHLKEQVMEHVHSGCQIMT